MVALKNRLLPIDNLSLPDGKTALYLSVGGFHSCVILDNSSISCWGQNTDGQLGDGTTTQRESPTANITLPGGRTALQISAGASHTCAILDNSSVSCWGENDSGQLGDGSTSQRESPVDNISLPGGRKALKISTSGNHTCAVLDNGSVSCWGNNRNGQLGVGSSGDSDPEACPSGFDGCSKTPIVSLLPSGRTAIDVVASLFHTCALLDNYQVACWGSNAQGRLGIGSTTSQSLPTMVTLPSL